MQWVEDGAQMKVMPCRRPALVKKVPSVTCQERAMGAVNVIETLPEPSPMSDWPADCIRMGSVEVDL
jgi:hypothetical protein